MVHAAVKPPEEQDWGVHKIILDWPLRKQHKYLAFHRRPYYIYLEQGTWCKFLKHFAQLNIKKFKGMGFRLFLCYHIGGDEKC
jgi:hypothetical protein